MNALRLPLSLATIVVACTVAACGGDPKTTGPRKPPPKTELIGTYECVQFLGFYNGSSGTGWYRGSCTAYVNVTNPTRLDSIEVQQFDVTPAYNVNRPDFETGTLVYDSASAVANINYATGRTSETYDVWVEGEDFLTRRFSPFDYTGDGAPDSLTITYRKIF